MTAEKALQIFKKEIYADGKEQAEANKVIEEALKKQTVKGIGYKKHLREYRYVGYCLACGLKISFVLCTNYCTNCGQKLREGDTK